MLKQFVLSSAIVLCGSAGTLAVAALPPAPLGIVQIEGYEIGATNGISFLDGHQTGNGSHTLCTDNNQTATKICGTWANQGQAGVLNQIGTAEGHCAVVDVGQIFGAGGSQTQVIGDCVDPMLQGQEFDLIGFQLVTKSKGGGSGQADHMFVGNQRERGGNPIGAMRESSSTGAFQNATLAGRPGAAGAVVNEMTVTTIQSQAIN
jgi:hypothetical protein